MKQYKFSLKDECMIEEVGYHPNFVDVDKEEIPVPKEFLSQFEDGKIYDWNDFYVTEKDTDYVFTNGAFVSGKAVIPKLKMDDTVLWIEALRTINKWSEGTIYLSGCIQELQKHYNITRK